MEFKKLPLTPTFTRQFLSIAMMKAHQINGNFMISNGLTLKPGELLFKKEHFLMQIIMNS